MSPVEDLMDQMNKTMAQMATIIAQQAAAATQRDALEDGRRAQQQAREEAQALTKGLIDFRRHDPPKFMGEADSAKMTYGFKRSRRYSKCCKLQRNPR